MKQITFDTYTFDELSIADKFIVVEWNFGYFDLDDEKKAIATEALWLKDAYRYLSDELVLQIITDFINKYNDVFIERFENDIFYHDGEQFVKFRVY